MVYTNTSIIQRKCNIREWYTSLYTRHFSASGKLNITQILQYHPVQVLLQKPQRNPMYCSFLIAPSPDLTHLTNNSLSCLSYPLRCLLSIYIYIYHLHIYISLTCVNETFPVTLPEYRVLHQNICMILKLDFYIPNFFAYPQKFSTKPATLSYQCLYS